MTLLPRIDTWGCFNDYLIYSFKTKDNLNQDGTNTSTPLHDQVSKPLEPDGEGIWGNRTETISENPSLVNPLKRNH